MKIVSTIVSFLIAITITGCKKKVPDATKENTVVTITFHSPVTGDIWQKGSETHIEAIIDADAMMGGWTTLIMNADKSDTIDVYTEYYEQTQYLAHYHWVPPSDTPDTLMIAVQALDKQGALLKEGLTSVICN